jgi:hypothetical protein
MNESIRNTVYDLALDHILAALEDGKATPAIAEIRESIRAGWSAALLDSGAPEEIQAKNRFPL